VFFQLARALPGLRFAAVTADPAAAAAAAAAPLPPNAALLPPAHDVGALLAGAAAVIVPSVWTEAYGMVAVDAALRGLPVLVSARGGLPEAGLGAAAVLPVAAMELPAAAGNGGAGDGGSSSGGAAADAAAGPCWARRAFPPQPPEVVAAWAGELRRLLLDPGCAKAYTARAAAARVAAAALVGGRGRQLAAFEDWLGSLAALPD
jgi:glycosyltransferase involved in cell wall biosynthesis